MIKKKGLCFHHLNVMTKCKVRGCQNPPEKDRLCNDHTLTTQ
jgi:hypothetical protein